MSLMPWNRTPSSRENDGAWTSPTTTARFQKLDFVRSRHASLNLASTNNGVPLNRCLNDRMFANDKGIGRRNLPFKLSVDSDRPFEIGFSFEECVFSDKGVLIVLKNGCPCCLIFFAPHKNASSSFHSIDTASPHFWFLPGQTIFYQRRARILITTPHLSPLSHRGWTFLVFYFSSTTHAEPFLPNRFLLRSISCTRTTDSLWFCTNNTLPLAENLELAVLVPAKGQSLF